MDIIGLKHSMPDVVVAGSVVVGTSVVGSTVIGSVVVGGSVVGSDVVGSAVVGAAVVESADAESTVVGAIVVGASVVGAAAVVEGIAFPWIQSTYVFTFVYTPGRSSLAQPKPHDTTPTNFPSQTKGPPLSP